jgi:hypothetical protein
MFVNEAIIDCGTYLLKVQKKGCESRALGAGTFGGYAVACS